MADEKRTNNTNEETVVRARQVSIAVVEVDTRTDMEAFDALPRRLRDWLNDVARIDWNVRGLLTLFETCHPVAVELRIDAVIEWMTAKEDAFYSEQRDNLTGVDR